MPEIRLPVFAGPLELLLHLIERNDLDITAVSLVAVADQYLAAIHRDGSVDTDALAEFVAIGAKLLYLKSRALLPRPAAEGSSAPASLEDDAVGEELVGLLHEYRRFRQAAEELARRQAAGLRVYPRQAPPPELPPGPGLDGVTLERLRQIMLEVLNRRPAAAVPRGVVRRDPVTLAQRLADIRDRLTRFGRLSFRALVAEARTRLEVIVSFFAVLELWKSGACEVRQERLWGDIELVAAESLQPAHA
ncbi:Segregation and condensation protein A [bacterium HR29]|nr:Segregation and condensation protein A [bacterium HR29]